MNKIILTLIAIGLLWNSYNSSLNILQDTSPISFDATISAELTPERSLDSQDEEREFQEFDFLALNHILRKLITLQIRSNIDDSSILLSYISPVFTPPPNLS